MQRESIQPRPYQNQALKMASADMESIDNNEIHVSTGTMKIYASLFVEFGLF